jgi:antitoxin MazE
MRARVVRIGNSRGIRIPKTVLEECGIEDDAELTVSDGAIVLRAMREPRAGWEQTAREMASRGDDALVGSSSTTGFDETEWEW